MGRPSVKNQLMVAAMAKFQALGYTACSVEDIVREAGVLKGSFYNHFKSKEALAIEAVKAYVGQSLTAIEGDGPRSPLQRLKEHFDLLSAVQRKARFKQGCLLANFSAEASEENPDLRRALVEGVDQWCDAVAKVIRQAQACGEISKKYKPDFLARVLGNAWEGAAVRSRATQSAQPLDEFMKMYFGGLLVWNEK